MGRIIVIALAAIGAIVIALFAITAGRDFFYGSPALATNIATNARTTTGTTSAPAPRVNRADGDIVVTEGCDATKFGSVKAFDDRKDAVELTTDKPLKLANGYTVDRENVKYRSGETVPAGRMTLWFPSTCPQAGGSAPSPAPAATATSVPASAPQVVPAVLCGSIVQDGLTVIPVEGTSAVVNATKPWTVPARMSAERFGTKYGPGHQVPSGPASLFGCTSGDIVITTK